jgi:hypothetical protein
VDTYVALEVRLHGQPWPRAAMTVWLLCADDGEALSSCEIYRMPSRLGQVPGHSYGIASVFTEAAKRRRGYVTEMLARLGDRLAGTEGAQAMFLYSDVALRTYQKSGFSVRPALNLAFGALPGDPRGGVDALVPEQGAAEALAGMAFPSGPFTILPVPDQIDWHLERERIFSELLERPRPPACGARAGAGRILWAGDPRESQLTILLLDAPGRAEAEALVACARRAAHAAGLTRVVLWKTPHDFPLSGGVLEDRLEHLDSVPMLRPLDPRVQAAHWDWIPRALWI